MLDKLKENVSVNTAVKLEQSNESLEREVSAQLIRTASGGE